MGCSTSKLINMDSMKILEIEKDKIDHLTFARFSNFYDGDTADITYVDSKNNIVKDRFRFYGYNSKEIKPPKNIKNRDQVIQEAKLAKEKLIEYLKNKICVVQLMGRDKYGRILGDVYVFEKTIINKKINYYQDKLNDESSVRRYMIINDYGQEYYGGKK